MANRPLSSSHDGEDEEGTDFSFDPGSQRELDCEDVCCVTGEEVKASFCRFPDYRRGSMMVMSKKAMIENLRNGTTLEKFKEVLVKRHGKNVLRDYGY
ncbi:MAG: hypothetical protein ABIL09_28925 [Gemmatimonadota bacterium]